MSFSMKNRTSSAERVAAAGRPRHSKPAAELTQLVNVGRNVIRLEARQIHVGHLSVRVEQKCHQTRFAEIWPPGDLLEGRCIGGGLALVEADQMACCAPPLRQPLSVGNVGG